MAGNRDDFDVDEDNFDPVANESNLIADDTVSDEDWDTYDENAVDPAQDGIADSTNTDTFAESPAKKSSGLGKLLISAVILVIAGYAVLHFMKKPTATVPAPASQQSSVTAPPVQAAAAPHALPVTAPLPDAASSPTPTLVKEASDASAPPMPMPITAATESTTAAAPTSATPSAPAGNGSETSGSLHMPKMQDVMLKSPAASVTTAAPAVIQSPSAPVSNGQNDPAMTEKIDTLMARIDHLESELQTLKEKSAVTLPVPVASAEAVVMPLSSKLGAPADSTAPKVQILGEAQNAVSSVMPSTPVKKPKPITKWVLKGAQPGQAMISRAGESDITTVSVGDTLQGIGTVTTIELQNGKWTVVGTKGRINQ